MRIFIANTAGSRALATARRSLWLAGLFALPSHAQNPPALTGVAKVEAGGSHACAATTGGGVLCWGRNHRGQLGIGSTAPTSVSNAVGVRGLAGPVRDLDGGHDHNCAVTTAGKAQCWGDNGYGQLGNDDRSLEGEPLPVDVLGLGSGVTMVAASGGSGENHSCALVTGGAIQCWGEGRGGQLGDGIGMPSWSPVGVANISGAKAVTVGFAFSCALTATNGVKCWGTNDEEGRLGNGSNAVSNLPADVVGLTSGVKAVSAGYYHSCAITATDSVKCWGSNGFGKLGNGSPAVYSRVPVEVSNLGGVKAIAAGGNFTCALTIPGAVWCWGANSFGELGGGSTAQESRTPVQVQGLPGGVKQLSVGTGADHACAVTADEHVRCWGANNFGQLGRGTNVPFSPVPVDVVLGDAIFKNGFERITR